jgi:hypothetical protein
MYKLYKDGITGNIACIHKQIDGYLLSIPMDESNTDYQQFLVDLANDVELLDVDGNPADQGTIKAILRGQV